MHQKLHLSRNDQLAISIFKKELYAFFGQHVYSFIMFGSKVKGTSTPDSDIDVFIVLDEVNSIIKNKVIDIAFAVNIQYEVYISPRVVSLKQFVDTAFHATPFIQYIEKEGIAL